MGTPTYREYLENYTMRDQIEREARRLQAQAVLKYLVRCARFCAWLASIRITLQAPSRAVY
jgi:hypothetical protein